MYRQSPSRNQRSKGIKVKYILQICLLLAVCFWLIYQVKHSHEKKKEFEESEAEALLKRDETIKLGRKDIIRPRDEIISTRNSKHDEPIEEEETTEEDENKQEDETEDKNVEEEKDSNVEDGQEHSDAEADREEDSADENENQEIESEDGHGQAEGESVQDENESMHEAREEHYKADDASSAVTHDTNQTGAGENENERMENSNERVDNVSEEENKENNNSEENNTGKERRNLEVENGGTAATVDRKSNTTTGETEVDRLGGWENGSPPNTTVIEMSDRDSTSNRSSEVEIENHESHDIASEQTNNSISNDGLNVFNSSSTDSAETKEAESHSQDFSSLSDNNAELESLWSEKNKTESLPERSDEIETEKSDYENWESTVTENLEDEIQHDGIDETDTSQKNVHMDLDTLPEIRPEGGSYTEDGVAAE